MLNGCRNLTGVCAALALTTLTAPVARALVDLEYRPLQQTTFVGDVVNIALYAVSDDFTDQSLGAINVILSWDPTKLELTSLLDNGPYPWLQSFFPDDSGLDGLNFPFAGSPPAVPANDGDAYYEAWSRWAPSEPAQALPEGLLVTTFRFRALAAGTTAVEILPSFGAYTHSRVMDGAVPGLEVTGQIGPPSQVTTAACEPPIVAAQGSRYITVSLAESERSVAIVVTGATDDSGVYCVSQFVQPDGGLDSEAFYQTSAAWGTVHIADFEIRPSATYQVTLDCGAVPGTDLSPAVSVTTWMWGDVNNDEDINADDILLVMDASQGIFDEVTLQSADLAGCQPDGQINADDILSVIDAVQGLSYPCPRVCSLGPTLADYALLYACLNGPSGEPVGGCEAVDLDGDGDVDLDDFRGFQNVFAGP